MKHILKDQYIDYLVGLKANAHPDLSVDKNKLAVRVESTSDSHFDIIDKMPSILVAMGQGSATYQNSTNKRVEIIDYENLIDQLPLECSKDIKRPDFILHQIDGTGFFIINELSQSTDVRNKRSKARAQLADALKHLLAVPETQAFINKFERKICIFSNKDRLIDVPNDSVRAFNAIKEYLPDPIAINFQPITKAGFEAWETASFDI